MKKLIRFSGTSLLKRQKGVAAVEFALIATLFFTVLFGIMEFGRVLYMMNTASEATRLGARLAVVCDMNAAPAITQKMQALANFIPNGKIDIAYYGQDRQRGGCDENDCWYVTVSITGLTVQSVIPLVPIPSFPMPSFATTLPRESMSSSFNGETNSICF